VVTVAKVAVDIALIDLTRRLEQLRSDQCSVAVFSRSFQSQCSVAVYSKKMQQTTNNKQQTINNKL